MKYWMLLALLALGCGDGSDDDGGSSGDGQVTAEWEGLCVATFEKDWAFLGFFDEEVDLRVSAGERYLLTRYSLFGDSPRASIGYLSAYGPVDFDIEVETADELPFTSNCEIDETELIYGVFVDTEVFEDEALTKKICTLPAGTNQPTMVAGAGLAGDLNIGGTQKCAIAVGSLSELCDGAAKGFVEASNAKIGDTTHTVIPVQGVRGPR